MLKLSIANVIRNFPLIFSIRVHVYHVPSSPILSWLISNFFIAFFAYPLFFFRTFHGEVTILQFSIIDRHDAVASTTTSKHLTALKIWLQSVLPSQICCSSPTVQSHWPRKNSSLPPPFVSTGLSTFLGVRGCSPQASHAIRTLFLKYTYLQLVDSSKSTQLRWYRFSQN